MVTSNSSIAVRGVGVGPDVLDGAGDAGAVAVGGEAKRRICRTTEVPALLRTMSRASSGVNPSSVLPSTEATTSPGLSPALSACEPSSGALITMWQSGPNGLQSLALPAESTA